jgi:4-amino-4-deoxy-L-arabinose transferase-like glycosyltransferase
LTPETDTGLARWAWPLAICLYFVFQTIYRWLIGGGLGLDESQMILWGRHLAWGYGPQPPLYSWLQWGVFRLVGDPLLALSLVKNALLCGTFLALYTLLRTAHPPRHAGLATAGLLLVPQIAWESQRALTHSVLATTLAALTYLAFWQLVLRERKGGHLALGVLIGLGLISKANYVVAPMALGLAALSLPELRCKLDPARLALSAGIALVVSIVPYLWIFRHQERALASAYKLDMAGEATARWQSALQGLGATAGAAVLFLLLPAVVAAFVLWRNRSMSDSPQAPPLDGFILRVLAAGLILTLVMVLATESTQVKDRWMQPVLFAAAPVIGLWLFRHVTERGLRWYGRAIGTCAVLVAVALPVHLVTGTPGDPARGGAPIDRIAPQIAAAFPDAGRVIADPEWVAGNLSYRHPAWEMAPAHAASLDAGETALLVWLDGPDDGAELAAAIGARSGSEITLGEPVRFAAPYPWQPRITFALYAARLQRAPETRGLRETAVSQGR